MNFAVKRPRLVEEDQLAAAVWYAVRFEDVRCVRLKRFHKYGVYYVIRGNEIRLLAIHHGSRDDRWLRERTNQLR